ncbi:MAG: flagellar basal body L-ring protein FlgH [Planctomycetaceae bacterium]|nr:flagellar basal body L-ring protein FlgH [Planctomycetaceae bacterium]
MNKPSLSRRAALGAMLLTAAASAAPARGESLWQRRDPNRAFLFFDTQARHKGDLITILIDEVTDVDNKEDRGLSKETETSKSSDIDSSASGDFGGPEGSAAFDFNSDSSRSFDGEASFSSEREFTTRVAATVIDVLPNGNLVIKGERSVDIAGDERLLVISGIVRPYDVSPDNTVQHRNIAQLRITYSGNGQEQAFVRQGMLGRMLNKLWPF